jgi:hypothetical protein
MGLSCGTNGNMMNIYIGYWWESQRESPLGRPRHRWVDNIRMDFRDRMGWCRLE